MGQRANRYAGIMLAVASQREEVEVGLLRRISPAIAMLSAVTACSPADSPEAKDGMPSASPSAATITWRPEVGQCHDIHAIRISRESYSPSDCAKLHVYQTVFVGEVTGEAAKAPASPELGTDEQVKFWEECELGFAHYFGGSWHGSRVKVKISFPSVRAWDAGQRWFACHAAVYESFTWINTSTIGSFENGVQTRSDLKLGCMQTGETTITAKACSEPHNAEYLAAFPSFTETKNFATHADKSLEHTMCQAHITRLGGSKVKGGSFLWFARDTDWQMGDHTIRCFLVVDSPVSKSLKIAG